MTAPITKTLDTGLRVVIIPSESKMLTVAAFVNAGAANETKEQNGLSHFLEHMAFKGTKKRSYNKISQDAERLGAEMNAFTDYDMTAYYIKGLADHRATFIDIIGDIFCNSLFDEDELEKEREVILQEYYMNDDKPSTVCSYLLNETSLQEGPWARKIIGTPENIKSFTRQNFLDYQKEHYTADNVIVGICGDLSGVRFEDVFDEVKKAFKNINRANFSKSNRVVPLVAGGIAVASKPVKQSSVKMSFAIPGANDPQHLIYQVACAVLSDGMSSPLFDEIREKRGLVYSVGAYADVREKHGQFVIAAGTTNDKLKNYFEGVSLVLDSLSTKVKPVDLERAKNSFKVSLVKQSESTFGQLIDYVSQVFSVGYFEDVGTQLEKINAVSVKDVQKALGSLRSSKATIAVVGPKIKFAEIVSIVTNPELKLDFSGNLKIEKEILKQRA